VDGIVAMARTRQEPRTWDPKLKAEGLTVDMDMREMNWLNVFLC